MAGCFRIGFTKAITFLALPLLLGSVPSLASQQPDRPAENRSPVDSIAARAYLERALTFIGETALNRDDRTWPGVLQNARSQAQGVRTESDTYPIITRVIRALNDRHSRFFPPDEARMLIESGYGRNFGMRAAFPEGTIGQLYPGGPAEKAGLMVGDTIRMVNGAPIAASDRGVLVRLEGRQVTLLVARRGSRRSFTLEAADVPLNSPPRAARLPHAVGYLVLPEHLGSGEIAGAGAYADLGHAAIQEVDRTPVCGWVIDLRRNGGGNLWPMLAAVGPILGDGPAGSFVGRGRSDSWAYEGGAAKLSGHTMANAEHPYVPPKRDLHVAILTSRVTASSGEALVVAFHGRPGTRSFGEATQGVPTANATRRLSDGALLVVTTAVDADRTGKTFSDRIEPDERIAIDWTQIGTPSDPVMQAALRWLATQPGCRDLQTSGIKAGHAVTGAPGRR